MDDVKADNFISLHNHTTFSLLDSLIKPIELFKKAKELGQEAIAVTDHGTLAGLWDALQASRSTGVKLITGCEFYFVDDVKNEESRLRHVILLAKNEIGYKNLLLCSAEGFDNSIIAFKRTVPRIDWGILEKYSEGLICLTACSNGILGQLINQKKFEEAENNAAKLKAIFGDNLGIELQAHALKRVNNAYSGEIDQQFTNDRLKEIAEKLDIRCVVTTDAHYLNPEQNKSHDVLLAIASGNPVDSGSRLRYQGTNGVLSDFYVKSGDEVFNKLERQYGRKDPGFARRCIENTKHFADLCEKPEWVDPKFSNPTGKELPEFPVQDQSDYGEFKEWLENNNKYSSLDEDKSYLRYRCEMALEKEFPNNTQYRDRLEVELDVLDYCGVSSYMLLVFDIIDMCKKNGIPHGPGRGCLSGESLVLTTNGFKRLDEINVKDEVYSHTGNKRKVLSTFKFDISKEDCLQIKTTNKFAPITLTKDHKVYASKRVNLETLTSKDYLKIKTIVTGYNEPEWVPACLLTKGDAIFTTFPIRNINDKLIEFDLVDYFDSYLYDYDDDFIYQKSNKSITVSLKKISKDTGLSFEKLRSVKNGKLSLDSYNGKFILLDYLKSKNVSFDKWVLLKNEEIHKIRRKIIIDNDFMYLLGRWVGDGCFHGKNDHGGITISFNANDVIGINKITSILQKKGISVSICPSKISKAVNLTVSFRPIYNLFKAIFTNYKQSHTKHFPCFFRSLNSSMLESLLYGLFDSDGNVNGNYKIITTTSFVLAGEIKELLLFLNIPSTVYEYKKAYRNNIKTHDTYKIYFKHSPVEGLGYYSIISEINSVKVDNVYDICVDKDHSYLTSNYVVHNSVGGSLVAYLLGIHKTDPIKYGLVFERFHSKLKKDYSDIDLDVSTKFRDRVIDYVVEKYGKDNVAAISNYNTLTPKVYARAIARAFVYGGDRKAAVKVGNLLADSIPADMKTVSEALEKASLFAEYAKPIADNGGGYLQLKEYAEDVGGQVVAVSTHAAGIIVNKRPLRGLVPLRRDKDGKVVIESEKNRAESLNLVKLDILGLSTLDIIHDTYELIKQSGKELIPFDYNGYDKKTYDLISSGDTLCVFQFGTSAGTVDLCKRYVPQNMEDLAIITTIARPASKEIRGEFFKVKNGEKPMEFLHPLLERSLKNTFGFALYDESLLILTSDIAGWSLTESDVLRKFTKAKGKNPEKEKQIKEKFIIDSTKEKLTLKEAEEIWTKVIEPFAKYSFNKSHAVEYSFLSYETAFLKANYPLEFLVTNLKHEVNSNSPVAKDNVTKIKEEIKKLNVKIVPPDVNKSHTTYTIIDDNTLLTGLDALKYIGKDAIPEILAKRPFVSFEDFLTKLDSQKVRAPAIQALAASGCLDSFNLPRKLMFLYAADYKKKLGEFLKKQKKDPETFKQFNYPWPEEEEWNIAEKCALERFYIGESLSGNKVEEFNGFFTYGATPFPHFGTLLPKPDDDMSPAEQRKYTKHVVLVQAEVKNIFEFKVKKEDSKLKGEVMAKVTLEDPHGNQMPMTCFPDGWLKLQGRCLDLSNHKHKLEPGVGLYINGNLNWYEGDISIIFEDLAKFSPPPQLPTDLDPKKVKLTFPRAKTNKSKQELKKEEDELDRTILLSEVEEDLINSGHADLDDEEND